MTHRMSGRRLGFLAAAVASLLIGTTFTELKAASHEAPSHDHGMSVKRAVAVVHSSAGHDVSGVVHFHQMEGKVKVTAEVSGLKAGARHGFHIHQYGDTTVADGTGAGGHYNPAGTEHGLPPESPRHAGDLGNLEADEDGNASFEATFENFSLTGKHPVLGRAVVIHAKPDDGGQPTGNAGPRAGIGVIGAANPDKQ